MDSGIDHCEKLSNIKQGLEETGFSAQALLQSRQVGFELYLGTSLLGRAIYHCVLFLIGVPASSSAFSTPPQASQHQHFALFL